MNGMEGIFAEMQKMRTNVLNEEQASEAKPKRLTSEQKQQLMEEVEAEKNNEINEEEDLNEMSRSAEKDMIKIARPIVQKMAYKAGVKVKNPGQNTSRFILVGDGAKELAPSIAKAIKATIKYAPDLEDARIKAAKVSAEDQKKYGIEGECAAVIVDAPGATDEEGELDESIKHDDSGVDELVRSTDDFAKKCSKKDSKNEDLSINKKSTNGRAFTVEINGKKYSYFPTEESGLTAKELGEKYTKIAKYSVGKALAWLKKNATTPDSYRKKAVNEEEIEFAEYIRSLSEEEYNNYIKSISETEINEEMTIIVDADDILKAASEIDKAKSDGKSVVVKQTASGFKVEATETEKPSDDEEPKKDDKEDPEAEEECSSKKDEACDKDEETCPVCGKKHANGENCCEEVDPKYILDLADAIFEAEEDGIPVQVVRTMDGFDLVVDEESLCEAYSQALKDKAKGLSDRVKYSGSDKSWNNHKAAVNLEKRITRDQNISSGDRVPVRGKSESKYKSYRINDVDDSKISSRIGRMDYGNKDLNKEDDLESRQVGKSVRRNRRKVYNEETDIAELAARLDECEGSDYMRKALENGKYDLVEKYLYLKED